MIDLAAIRFMLNRIACLDKNFSNIL